MRRNELFGIIAGVLEYRVGTLFDNFHRREVGYDLWVGAMKHIVATDLENNLF